MNDQKCQESRKLHMALEVVDLGSDFDAFATAALLGLPAAFAYNAMSHVMMGCDLVEIESGSWGYRPRNSWGQWGAKNTRGKMGFNTWRESYGPNSGMALRVITNSIR